MKVFNRSTRQTEGLQLPGAEACPPPLPPPPPLPRSCPTFVLAVVTSFVSRLYPSSGLTWSADTPTRRCSFCRRLGFVAPGPVLSSHSPAKLYPRDRAPLWAWRPTASPCRWPAWTWPRRPPPCSCSGRCSARLIEPSPLQPDIQRTPPPLWPSPALWGLFLGRSSSWAWSSGCRWGSGLEERLGLGLDHKIARTFAEVEEKVNRRMGRLRAELQRREAELQRREAELERERRDGERLKGEKQEVEERAAYLSRQVSAAMEMMERLKKDLEGKERELRERQQSVHLILFMEMVDIECFLRETAQKEVEAKSRLQVFIETLLERADRAERQLLLLSTHTHHNHYTHRGHAFAEPYTPLPARGGRSLDASTDDIFADKMQESIGNRRSDRSYEDFVSGFRVGEAGCGRTWSKRNRRHHSTEEEEEDEEEDEGEEEGFWSSAEMRRLVFSRTHTPGSEAPSSLRSTPSHRRHGDRQLGADTLRLRAGLFCVFPYLDVRSLLCAAEVCSDWRFVARHPAVWTRLRLENARVSAEFLTTLSQWCTQTQSLVLNNLKPRSKRSDETREDYHKNTRGSVEPGVEALLRSAGGSLLHLSVSQCPHILTDRTLWLASCYSRNLQTLTYRSSSDPLGQEVLWALGAGCRSISSLQVAPAHPCQQPTRFGNRCLQTIGRCWPHLCSLSVGGASCGTQGLVAVVRSCTHLQVLELERITDLGLQAATELCKVGLKSLETLILTHTPVSGQAILHFHSMCDNIRSIVVEVAVSDYFEEPDTQEAQHLFGEILTTLKPEPPLVPGEWVEHDKAPPLIKECPGQSFQAWRLLKYLKSSLSEADDILLEPYLQSWDQLLNFMESLGTMVGFFSQKVKEKIVLIRALSLKHRAEAHGKRDPSDRSGLQTPASFGLKHGAYRSLRSMVEAELNTGVVNFSRRTDSGCRTLLRLHRSLLWLKLMLEGLAEGPDADGRYKTPGELSRDAYKVALAPHHPWVLRQAAEFVFLALPDRRYFLQLTVALSEGFVTHGALVWSLPVVGPHVDREVFLPRARLPTNPADEQFDAQVAPHVVGQVSLAFKKASAL
ncbi:hypothetical protein L3Q82_003740 [Scortum barcoo]|uniref:Uncharacterized protein n=1 Tax=Scortum barcoo TaxID=214431 RepID=A0ACB8X745_9TELE|nr:hypothetical protein L3Q82_003740 [Scortum barcoo]